MRSKTEPKTKTSKQEDEFMQFAKALMAVPKKELDKQLAKHERHKEKTRKPKRA